MSRAGAADQGFTLLELLVVLVIMAVLAVAVAGRVSGGFGGGTVRSDADRLVEDLRRTRELARSRADIATLEIAPDGAGWSGVRLATGTRVRLWPEPDDGVAPIVRFFPDGSAEARELRLEGTDDVVVVRVEPITGAVGVTGLGDAD